MEHRPVIQGKRCAEILNLAAVPGFGLVVGAGAHLPPAQRRGSVGPAVTEVAPGPDRWSETETRARRDGSWSTRRDGRAGASCGSPRHDWPGTGVARLRAAIFAQLRPSAPLRGCLARRGHDGAVSPRAGRRQARAVMVGPPVRRPLPRFGIPRCARTAAVRAQQPGCPAPVGLPPGSRIPIWSCREGGCGTQVVG